MNGRTLYIKRDDLIDKDLSGNKFRKLQFLLNTPSKNYKRIISYGGNQSNAMASIAALCRRKEWEFLYISKTLSETLKHDIKGNLKAALEDGMTLLEIPHIEYREVVASLHSPLYDHRVPAGDADLLLAQGGADLGAKEGIRVLAEEIKAWQAAAGIENLTVVTPSGTGTTAKYLADNLSENSVFTTPLIGSKEYLQEQMSALGPLPSNLIIHETEKNYRFAKLYPEYLAIFQELLSQNIEIDLLYAPKMFIALWEVLQDNTGDVLYVHSGGVQGNESMLERYHYKGWL